MLDTSSSDYSAESNIISVIEEVLVMNKTPESSVSKSSNTTTMHVIFCIAANDKYSKKLISVQVM